MSNVMEAGGAAAAADKGKMIYSTDLIEPIQCASHASPALSDTGKWTRRLACLRLTISMPTALFYSPVRAWSQSGQKIWWQHLFQTRKFRNSNTSHVFRYSKEIKFVFIFDNCVSRKWNVLISWNLEILL
jgi:hypothetical protein